MLGITISGNTVADLNEGLVAYYPFNGNANDESGNGYNGIVDGATLTDDRFGHSNSAYNFDGINDCISVNSAPLNSSSFNSSEATFSAWFKVNELNDSLSGYLVNFSNTSDTDFASIYYRPDAHVISSTRGSSFGDYFKISQVIESTGWHFVASIYIAGQSHLYVDGHKIDQTSGFNVSGINALLIGCDQNRGGVMHHQQAEKISLITTLMMSEFITALFLHQISNNFTKAKTVVLHQNQEQYHQT